MPTFSISSLVSVTHSHDFACTQDTSRPHVSLTICNLVTVIYPLLSGTLRSVGEHGKDYKSVINPKPVWIAVILPDITELGIHISPEFAERMSDSSRTSSR